MYTYNIYVYICMYVYTYIHIYRSHLRRRLNIINIISIILMRKTS